MRVAAHYSHLNGLEYLQVHEAELWEEITAMIGAIQAQKRVRARSPREYRTKGALLRSDRSQQA